LFDSGKVEFAHPNFIKEKKLRWWTILN
jgi:hypothetical protein